MSPDSGTGSKMNLSPTRSWNNFKSVSYRFSGKSELPYKVARIEFSSLWCFLPSSLHTLILGVEEEAGVLSSPWKHRASDQFTVLFWAGELPAYAESSVPILFPRAVAAVSDVTFVYEP